MNRPYIHITLVPVVGAGLRPARRLAARSQIDHDHVDDHVGFDFEKLDGCERGVSG